jgi:hypothetical protein
MNRPKFGLAAVLIFALDVAAIGLMLAVGLGADESLIWLAVALILVGFGLVFKLLD